MPLVITRDDVARLFASDYARITRPLERWDEERVHEALGFRRKAGVVLFGINEHEVHHRAQLMTYLRMLGTPAPEPFARR